MSEIKSFRSILKGSKYDILVLLSTFLLTVLVDLTVAIQVGIVLAALLFMQRMASVAKVSLPDSESDIYEDYSYLPKGIDVYEINGPFFFAAAQKYKETLKDISHKSKVMILRMRNVPFIDATGIHSFKEILKELESRQVKVLISGANSDVLNELKKAGIVEMLGEGFICDNFSEARDLALKLNK